ncbi:MAG: hypothetical protein ACO1NZ_08675 [Adhaeribacter sp.]
MEKAHILMLGWENPVATAGPSESWLSAARDLAPHTLLHVLLPRSGQLPGLPNVQVTDLSHSRLPDRTYQEVSPEQMPYGPAPFPGMTIPLYGTPVYTGKAPFRTEPFHPGEALAAGRLGAAAAPAGRPAGPAPESPDLHQQVIDYARKACRFAQHLPFGEIYAFHWQTYLAALELKTITGKKLMVRYRAASQEQSPQMAWMLQLEKQVIEKADVLLVDNDGLAAFLAKEYGSAAGKLHLLPGRPAPAGGAPRSPAAACPICTSQRYTEFYT